MMAPLIEANGILIPAIGLGTGRLRGDVAIAAIHAALDCGYRHIDAAARYGNESEVGEAIATHALPREDVFITTKYVAQDYSGDELMREAEAGLTRLRISQADLILLHWPNQKLPLAPQIRALCELRNRGLARSIGVSNFGPAYIKAALALADQPIAVNQIERHPYLDQDALASLCRAHGIATVAFSPMGRGALMQEPVIAEIAEEKRRSPAQIVLRWHMEKEGNIAVPLSSNPGRIAENIDIFDFHLTSEESARISALAHPEGRVVRGPEGYDWNGTPL